MQAHESYDPSTLYRLCEGVERFLNTDINNPAASALAQSELGFFFDYVAPGPSDFNHIPGGGNVLYMDGHVGFFAIRRTRNSIAAASPSITAENRMSMPRPSWLNGRIPSIINPQAPVPPATI